jgi:hypothetical protein
MRRSWVFVLALLGSSAASSANDTYELDFPPAAVSPIVTATCDGLDLPCRKDWSIFTTQAFRPFKWAQSIFRFPEAPSRQSNMFGFVELPYIEHGEEDYAALRKMIGQAGPSAERLWIDQSTGLRGTGFGVLYRVVPAVVTSHKITDAVALCKFPSLNGKTAAPDQCQLLAFRSDTRKFLLSSIGFDAGRGRERRALPYDKEFASRVDIHDIDLKLKLIKSRMQLENLLYSEMKMSDLGDSLFSNSLANKTIDNLTISQSNESEKIYLSLISGEVAKTPNSSYLQTVWLSFLFSTGWEWNAEMADGTESWGIDLSGDKKDWQVSMRWQTRTAVSGATSVADGGRVFSFRGPQAAEANVIDDARTAFVDAMKRVCAPLSINSSSDPTSEAEGVATISCHGE